MQITPEAGSRPFALAVSVTVAALSGLVAFTASAGIVDSMPLAWIAALAAAIAASAVLWRRPETAAALARVPRGSRVAFVIGAAVLLPQLLAVTLFIVDANSSTWTASVWHPIPSRHSCVSAYWVAAQRVTRVPDLYAESVYRPVVASAAAAAVRGPNLGPFIVDPYEYPPAFLPLPRLLGLVSPDFWTFRRLWFALNLAGVAVGLVAIARRLDARAGTQAVWLTPLVLAAPAVLSTLEVGNVQLLFIVASAVAMWLFERRQYAAGGVLLGYAVASKLFPGVLLLFLLLRRDWRAIAWTTAAGLAITLLALADVGWTPFGAFLEHLPKLLSGEAFPGLKNPAAIAINESVPGIVFKLPLFGLPNLGFAGARILGWAYTLVLAGVTAWMALGVRDRAKDPLLWVAILLLATLRSPFLPFYGAFPALWLATLVYAGAPHRPGIRWVTIALALVLAVSPGQGVVSPQLNAIATFVHTIAGLVLVFLALRPEPASEPLYVPRAADGVAAPA